MEQQKEKVFAKESDNYFIYKAPKKNDKLYNMIRDYSIKILRSDKTTNKIYQIAFVTDAESPGIIIYIKKER